MMFRLAPLPLFLAPRKIFPAASTLEKWPTNEISVVNCVMNSADCSRKLCIKFTLKENLPHLSSNQKSRSKINICVAYLRRKKNEQNKANVTAQHFSFKKCYFIKYGRIDVICGLKKVAGKWLLGKASFFLETIWERDEKSKFWIPYVKLNMV